jgi:hypothetical protein
MAQEQRQVVKKEASEKAKEEAKSKALSGVALYVAVFAVLAWLGFTIFMFTNTDADEVTWARQAWVFGSVEAVSFAAAGLSLEPPFSASEPRRQTSGLMRRRR